jgi:hypothetical protein
MASLRKRIWKSGGEIKTAWVANYNDQGGKRHLKTFPTRKAADAWLVAARGQVQRGVDTAASASITVARAGEDAIGPALTSALRVCPVADAVCQRQPQRRLPVRWNKERCSEEA